MVAVGSILQETYRIEEPVGQGGMGVVFRASHVRLPKRFAIKVLQLDVSKDKGAFARFRREAEIASAIGHPNIVEVQDFNVTADGQPYIVMELLEGRDLSQRLAVDGALSVENTVRLAQPIARALTAAHAAGVVHRDLKPQNIFLAHKVDTEVVKILDFGISKILGATDMATGSAETMGTPGYMSPEQAQGDSATVDARSDQFSFGAIVYQMLSGRHPFVRPGDSVYRVLLRIVHDEAPPIVGVSDALQACLAKAMAKKREDRYPDVRAFLQALELAGLGHVEHVDTPRPPSLVLMPPARLADADALAATTPNTPSRFAPPSPDPGAPSLGRALGDGDAAHPSPSAADPLAKTRDPLAATADPFALTTPQPAGAQSAPASGRGDAAEREHATDGSSRAGQRSWKGRLGAIVVGALVAIAFAYRSFSGGSGAPGAPGRAHAPAIPVAGPPALVPAATPPEPTVPPPGSALVPAATPPVPTVPPPGSALVPAAPPPVPTGMTPGQKGAPAATPPPAATSSVRLVLFPTDARATLDGKPVAGDTLQLARGAASPTLRVSAPGYVAQERQVPTDRDQTLTVRLARAITRGAPPSHRQSTGSKQGRPDELDDPFSK